MFTQKEKITALFFKQQKQTKKNLKTKQKLISHVTLILLEEKLV